MLAPQERYGRVQVFWRIVRANQRFQCEAFKHVVVQEEWTTPYIMALKWGISFPDVLLKGQQKKIKFGLLGNRRSSSSLIHKKTPRGSFLSSSGETMLKAQPATVFLQISLFLQISSFYKFHFNKTCSPSPPTKNECIYIYIAHIIGKHILNLWKSTLLPCHVAKGWNLWAEDSLLSQITAWRVDPFPHFSTRKVWMCEKFRNT